MRSRSLWLLPLLAAGCADAPWDGVLAEPDPVVAKPRATVAPAEPAPPPKPIASASAPAPSAASPSNVPGDAALLTEVPPELVDDGSDDVKDADPSPPAKKGEPVTELASTAKETWVYAEPRWKARRIGYLRAGAIVERRAQPAMKNASCPEGWYRIEPKGFVCAGATATLNLADPIVVTSAKRPDRETLPYTYVMPRFPPPPLYARLPSVAEAKKVEPDLVKSLREAARSALDPAFVAPPPPDEVPGVLLFGQSAPVLGDQKRPAGALTIGKAKARSGFALLSTFEHDDRRYGLTTELALIPLDRTRVIKPSAFHGIKFDGEVTLPVVFVKSKHAVRYTRGAAGGATPGAALGFREAVPITGPEKHIGGQAFYEARDGSLIRVDQSVKVDRAAHPPAWAQSGRKWVDVSILHQSLVAYEGMKPIYATLVSTGADGLGDPKKTHSTIQGAFLIHTKHISTTMDDDKKGDEFDFRDVPYVQYFTEGFALHGAYWHDEFGTPRSHGCVNLAPIDAAWLFNWTDPDVPKGWHGALSLRKGTLVYTHP